MGRSLALLATATISVALGAPCIGCPQHSPDAAERPMIAIEKVAVVDVTRGAIVAPRTVLIVDGQIAAIAQPEGIEIPHGAVRVDGRGRYLIPGLVDMHVHLFNNATHRPPNDWTFPLFVANGVTGVREMAARAADLPTVASWNAAAVRGDLIAPRVLATGVAVGGDAPDTAQRQMREAHAAGADFAKVFSEVGEPQWRAILDEARALQMPVCGHIPAEIRLLDAAAATGQRSNEHLTQVYEACSAREDELLGARKGISGKQLLALRDAQELEVLESFDQRLCDRTAAALARTGQTQVPTLVLSHFDVAASRTNFHEDKRWRYLRLDEQGRWERLRKEHPATDEKLTARRLAVSLQIVKTLHAAGVRILAGTDAPMPLVYPGYALHKELQLLVQAGMTPADALRSATIWPAEFLGQAHSIGSIAIGKRADLVLLDADPLEDINYTQRIRAVVLDGRLLDRRFLSFLREGLHVENPEQPADVDR